MDKKWFISYAKYKHDQNPKKAEVIQSTAKVLMLVFLRQQRNSAIQLSTEREKTVTDQYHTTLFGKIKKANQG